MECDLPRDEWIRNIGTAIMVFDPVEHFEKSSGKTLDREAYDAVHRVNEMEVANTLPLQPGLMSLLREARRSDILCGVASGSSHRWVEGHLNRRGIREMFTTVVCREDTQQHKPDPEPYLLACEKLGVSVEHAIAIEDSSPGVAAAKAAGLYTIAVPCSMTGKMDFREANRIVSSLEDVSLEELRELNGEMVS